MGYKCCVPGCKSNYDSKSKDGNQKSVSTFRFPKDEQITITITITNFYLDV